MLVNAPDPKVGKSIARALVERRLAACVNLVPAIESVYRWQGAVEEASETLLVVKTTRGRYGELERELATLHPYQVPECVALEPAAVRASYLAWLVEQTLDA